MILRIHAATAELKGKMFGRIAGGSRARLLLQTSRLVAAALLCGASAGSFGQSTAPSPFDSESISKANDLLRKMTVDEKIGQTVQYFYIYPDETIPAEQVRKGLVGSYLLTADPKVINDLQHVALTESRLHIPLLFGFDVIHGLRTMFPVPLAMAASWDPKVAEEAQATAAAEAHAVGLNWTFAPMVDIARDARWGRMVEGAGEDPYLGATMARAQVRGFQGAHIGDQGRILATVKHFAAYGAADGGRDYDSAYVPEVLLRNVYLPPYKAGVDAGAGTIMSAYQDMNDVPATANRFLLQDVLRHDWGFKGFVVSDSTAVFDLATHGFAKNEKDAAFRALQSGVNMEMGFPTITLPADNPRNPTPGKVFVRPGQASYWENLSPLVKEGKLSEAQLDDAVRPILAAKYQLGLFEHPYVDEKAAESTLVDPAHRKVARSVAASTVVLLRNENNTLPLKTNLKSIAVIGTLADSRRDIMGSWAFKAQAEEAVTVLDGLKNKLPDAHIEFVRGAEIKRPLPSPADYPPPPPVPDQTEAQFKEQLELAVLAAKRSEVSIIVLGERQNMSGEAASRAGLDLPGRQEQVLEAVAKVGKPVVLVLLSGRPLVVSWAASHIPAILEAWYPGSEGGNAIADVLFGDVNPSGKLPVTWPRSTGQEPLFYAHNLTHKPDSERDFTSRYWDELSSPLYPFGYGLSYSTFAFGSFRMSKGQIPAGTSLDASIDVKNLGTRAGEEVVQLYLHQRAGSASRPERELKGFQKVLLAPGEMKTVHFSLGPDELSFWSPQAKNWVLEPGKFDVWAGGDSDASSHATFEVTAPKGQHANDE